MKGFLKIVKVLIFTTLMTLTPSIAEAQEYVAPPVTISKEKIRIDGQICYSHVVLERQTLYSISKAYNVSIEDIYKFNPSVKIGGLKKNSIIIIPMVTSDEKKPEEILRKETVKTEEPQKQKAGASRTHIVKWFEDIEFIAERYGVSVSAIMQANNLSDRKLFRKQKLIIPNPGEYPDESMIEISKADSTGMNETPAQEEEEAVVDFTPKKHITASVLLPFNATGQSGNRQSMDFYSGMLLAVHDMQKEGIGVDLNTYDTSNWETPVSRDELTVSDVVIGPISYGDISRVSSEVPQIQAIVSPLDPRVESLVQSQHSLIQVPTPHQIQYKDLIDWLRSDLQEEDRTIMISEKGARTTEATTNMKAAMDSSGIEYNALSYSILEGRDVTDTLTRMMTDSAANRVFIASESEAFVNDVVRNLNVMVHRKYDIVLYAPSKIRSFETIEVENFHNTKMHVSTGYYIDYEDPKVMNFLLRYRALYNAEPSQFAYQGYDVGRYFLTLCSKYGDGWMEKIDDEHTAMLQSSFKFTATENGGFINTAVRRIVYGPNWSVRILH